MSRQYPIQLVPLARWYETDALTLNEERLLTPANGYGELIEGSYVAEISHVEIITSTTAIAPADIQDVVLRLDGREDYPWVRFNGRMDATTAPPTTPAKLFEDGNRWSMYTLGLPIGRAPFLAGTNNRDPRFCTMPKYRRSVGLKYVARTAVANGVTRQFVVWGYLYPVNAVANVVGRVGGQFALNDLLRNRSTVVDYPVRTANPGNWTQLPGGQDQGQPAIYAFLRDSINGNATSPNEPYQFRLTGDNVDRDNQELYFPYQLQNNALWIQRLGVRATSANLKNLLLRLGDDEFPMRRGSAGQLRGWPTQREYNPLFHYGQIFPEGPQDSLQILPVPRLVDKSFVIHKEIGQINIVDNGTAVAADTTRLTVAGLMIEGV